VKACNKEVKSYGCFITASWQCCTFYRRFHRSKHDRPLCATPQQKRAHTRPKERLLITIERSECFSLFLSPHPARVKALNHNRERHSSLSFFTMAYYMPIMRRCKQKYPGLRCVIPRRLYWHSGKKSVNICGSEAGFSVCGVCYILVVAVVIQRKRSHG